MQRNNISALLSMVGLIVILSAAALPFFHLGRQLTAWVYGAGAVMLLIGKFMSPVPANAPIRLRRLLRMEIWTALIFVAGAVFLFLPQAGGNDWIAFTLAGGLLTVYTSIMIPRESKKGTAKPDKKRK